MKAILILDDMPKTCAECPLRTSLEANYLYCVATLPRLKIDPMTAYHIKEHKCPLKPMPQKLEVEVNKIEDIMHTEFSIEDITAKIQLDTDKLISLGWNACLEEIENG